MEDNTATALDRLGGSVGVGDLNCAFTEAPE